MCEPTNCERTKFALTERELIELAQQGDRAAQTALVEQYYRLIWRYIQSFVRREDVADDLTQQVFLTVFRKLETFEYLGEGCFKGWLKQIGRRAIWGHTRPTRKRRPGEMPEGCDPAEPDAAPTDPRLALLGEALEKLSDEDRTILRNQFWEKMTYEEIAEKNGMSINMVKDRLQRAKARLARVIDQILRDMGDVNPDDLPV